MVNHIGKRCSNWNVCSVSWKAQSSIYNIWGDGDTNSFGKVKQAVDAKFSDSYNVIKEDCIGYIKKRIGTALRSYKNNKKRGVTLSDGKCVGG